MLPRLPERGYALSKTCGLLVVGYAFWLLSSLGYLRLTSGGVMLSGIVVAAGAFRFGKPRESMEWLRAHRYWALACEGVFLIGFASWAYVRALNPEIMGTEKPMEFAFLNSVLRGGVMPPRDPWLSGYAISYYYFGYVIIAMLTRITGVAPSVAFNLGVALVFGLAAVGAFGVALNLMAVSARSSDRGAVSRLRVSRFAFPALLAPVFAVISGNFNGVLEVLHQRGLLAARFWEWLGVKWMDAGPTLSEAWMPQRYLWWWQASRVIRDRDLTGTPIDLQPIAEFPFFSFLLGDLHPHVLALPFVFLALAVALEIFLTAAGSDLSESAWLPIPVSQMLFFGLVLGGLAFLNMWDFPVYLMVVVAGYAAGRREIGSRELRFGVVMAALSGLLYLPFYLGFRSQAGGVLPNPVFATQLNQFTVLFGVLLVPAFGWLLWESARARRALNWRLGLLTGPGVLAAMVITCGVLTSVILLMPEFSELRGTTSLLGTLSTDETVRTILRHRFLDNPSTMIILTGALMLAGGMLPRKTDRTIGDAVAAPFVAVLLGVGALVTLCPEFLYLRDNFGSRMNTIFKFYYQAWALWSIVATYGCWRVWQNSVKWWRIVFGAAVAFSLAGGLTYTMLSIWTKTAGLQGTTVISGERVAQLDGMIWMAESQADDYEAIYWLNNFLASDGNIVEAVGGSYSNYARVSAHSGLPTVLGWPGHELQWRGDFGAASGREQAVNTLYSTRAWDEAVAVLSRYDIRYVYVGHLERRLFPAHGLQKFDDFMHAVYRNTGVTIYERVD